MNRGFLAISMFIMTLFTSVNINAESGKLLGSSSITWTLDDSGTLTVTGSGDMPNATSSTLPFKDLKSKIKSIVISGDITSVGDYVFYELTSTTSLTITAPITSTGNYSFASCSALSTINFTNREHITTVGEATFAQCYSLTTINIPENVKTIGNHAFLLCSSLQNLTIGENVESIGDQAFLYCYMLPHLYLPNSVKTIGANAFEYCSGMEWVTFGTSVESIGDNAFFGCSGLKRVNSLNPVPPTMNCDYDASCDKDSGKSHNVFDKNTYDTATLRTAAGYGDVYKVADGWKHFKTSVIYTGISEVENDGVNVYGCNGEIRINGADEASLVEVYNLGGQQIYRGAEKVVAVPAGFYVVKVAGKAVKTVVKD